MPTPSGVCRRRPGSRLHLASLAGLGLLVVAALAWWVPAPPAAEVLPAQDFNAVNLARLADLRQNPVTFAVFGDSRNHNGIFPALLNAVARDQEMDFAVHLGDLVRDGELWEYKLFFQDLKALGPLPLITVVGNHELNGDGRRLFGKIFGPANFSFRLGGHAFVVLNNNAREGLTEAEWEWLAGTLKTCRDARRRLLFLHVPLFDPRPDRAKPHAMAPGPARRLLALLKEHGVSHVFAGHIHGYFTGDWEGLPYTISGGAGVSLEGRDPRHYFHHYLKVRLDGEAMRVDVKPLEPPQ